MGDSKTTRKVSFVRGLRNEFKKIVWPSFTVLMKQSGIVIVVALIIGALVAGIDQIFGAVVRLVLM